MNAPTSGLSLGDLNHSVQGGAAEIRHIDGYLGDVPVLKHNAECLYAVKAAAGSADDLCYLAGDGNIGG